MATVSFYMKVGDTKPDLQVSLKDGDGNGVDVTGATVKFSMLLEGGTTLTINEGTVTLVTPASGIVKYQWTAPDVALAGTFLGEFEVTYSGGGIETFANSKANQLYIIFEDELG